AGPPGHLQLDQAPDQATEALAGIGDLKAGSDPALVVNDADRVGSGCPVDAGVQQLLHLGPPWGDDGGTVGAGAPCRLLIAWRSNPRIPSAGLGSPARRTPRISCWSSKDKPAWRSPDGHRGFVRESHPTHPSQEAAPKRVGQ